MAYTSKRAQVQEAQALNDCLEWLGIYMSRFSEAINLLKESLRIGKSADKGKTITEIIKYATEQKGHVKAYIARLKGISPNNPGIADFSQQCKEYSEELDILVEELTKSKVRVNKKHNEDDNEEDDEPSEDEINKQYLRSLIFDRKDAEKVVQQLNELAGRIPQDFNSFSLMGDNYAEARDKFEDGLMILSRLDPGNDMIPVFQKKLPKWDEIHKSNQKKRRVTLSIIGVCILGYIAYYILME